MKFVTITAVKKHFAQFIAKVGNGEEVIITRRSKPVARLVKFTEAQAKREPGRLKGQIEIGPEFFEPLPEDDLAAWGQSDDNDKGNS